MLACSAPRQHAAQPATAGKPAPNRSQTSAGWEVNSSRRRRSKDVLQCERDGAVAALAGDFAERGAGGARVGAAPVGWFTALNSSVRNWGNSCESETPFPEAAVAEQVARLLPPALSG